MNGDRWVKCISQGGTIRGVTVLATELVRDMQKRHNLSPVGARGLAEATLSALLIAQNCKQGERINLNIQGSGYYRQALVDAYPDGTVRGYIIENPPDQSQNPLNSQSGPWGGGLFSVLRTRTEEKERPYIGTVQLVTGHLAKDLTYYWVQSEQIPSAAGFLIEQDEKEIKSAIGFLVQAMPGASTEEISSVEKPIRSIKELAADVAKDPDPVRLLGRIFQDTTFILLEEKKIAFNCHCSQERVERALSLIGVTEIQSILDDDGEASVRCDFCSKEYTIGSARLKEMILAVSKKEN